MACSRLIALTQTPQVLYTAANTKGEVPVKILRLAFVFALCCAGLFAQATSQIQGVVQDASGSAVPGAEVKATQTDTGTVRTATTAADGVYVLSNLPIGPYRIEVGKAGFATYVQTGIVLQVASNPTVDVQLKVGAVSEQMQVEANATQVETQTTSVGTVIESQRILDLPLNGRQATDLDPAGGRRDSRRQEWHGRMAGRPVHLRCRRFAFRHWLLPRWNSCTTTRSTPPTCPFPFPDALQEFKVETSTLTAQNGLHSAAAVNAVTRSGTNAMHGDLFEFLRNGDLNARNFFALKRDTLKRNQFGGTVGGPILKDKLFFFAGYQGTRTRSDPGFVDNLRSDCAGCSQGDFTSWVASCNGGKNLTGPVRRQQNPALASEPAGAADRQTSACGKQPGRPMRDESLMAP